jgi:hypothetical protein
MRVMSALCMAFLFVMLGTDSGNAQPTTRTKYVTGYFNGRGVSSFFVDVPRFDPALGSLTSVEVTISGYYKPEFGFENTGSAAGGRFVIEHEVEMGIRYPQDIVPEWEFERSYRDSARVDIFDSVLDFLGTSGRTIGRYYSGATSVASVVFRRRTSPFCRALACLDVLPSQQRQSGVYRVALRCGGNSSICVRAGG